MTSGLLASTCGSDTTGTALEKVFPPKQAREQTA